MKDQRNVTSPNTNDVEMVLATYRSVMNGNSPSLASYADYVHYEEEIFGLICKKHKRHASGVIHNHEDNITREDGSKCG
jgi:hypothetical protein